MKLYQTDNFNYLTYKRYQSDSLLEINDLANINIVEINEISYINSLWASLRNINLKIMKNYLLILFAFFCIATYGQSKMELQNFIVSDLKSSSGTWKSKPNSVIFQIEKNYTFTFNNCDLIITSEYSSDGVKWNKMKYIIPITDINIVRVVKDNFYSDRLMIETSSHSISRYCDGKLLDFDDSLVIGLGTYAIDIGSKYKSIFTRLSKYCN